ncbi:MAG: chemotaxis protein CheW [Calditrichia bacterium]|nr:chemotaxis protein CheW [Calditrichia bacterium]
MEKIPMADEILQLVSFNVGTEEFGVDILRVHEINRMTEITRVPKTPHFVEGVINLRGKIIPIIDLRKRFGMETKEQDQSTRIVVVEIDGQTIGFVVDSVSEVIRLPMANIDDAPDLVTGVDADYIQGVGKLEKSLIILLDLEKVLSKTELDNVDKMKK